MMLSDADIMAEMRDHGGLMIEPFHPAMLQPASYDVRLSRVFRVFDTRLCAAIDPEREQDLTRLTRVGDEEQFMLRPGEFVLASTVETVTLGPAVAARLEGKSSLGRLGLMTHSTAGFIDPGFTGQVTLELSNVASLPILLRPGMRIGQLCFIRLSSAAERPYGSAGLGSKYQGQRGPTASRAYADGDRRARPPVA